MTTTVTVSVPHGANYKAEVEQQFSPRGPHDDGVRRAVVQPGESFTFHIYAGISVKSIREVPL